MGNQKRTIQRHWKDWAHKTQDEGKQKKKTNKKTNKKTTNKQTNKQTQHRKLQAVLYYYTYNENPSFSLLETLKPLHKRSVMDIEDTNNR